MLHSGFRCRKTRRLCFSCHTLSKRHRQYAKDSDEAYGDSYKREYETSAITGGNVQAGDGDEPAPQCNRQPK
jgi:hypothetical protein